MHHVISRTVEPIQIYRLRSDWKHYFIFLNSVLRSCNKVVFDVSTSSQVKVVEETIRYIDQLHRMLAKRVQADDICK